MRERGMNDSVKCEERVWEKRRERGRQRDYTGCCHLADEEFSRCSIVTEKMGE